MSCPLCSSSFSEYSADKNRKYFLCDECSFVFISRQSHISSEKEKDRYDTHQNNDDDQKYQDYLGQIINEIKPHIINGELALDFGCGRTEVLGNLLNRAGLNSESYDLYYLKRDEIWSKKFDVIVLSEVIEHLRDLESEMKKLTNLLTSSGRFFIKTKMRPATKEEFDRWYYKNDPTHVGFFNEKSFMKLSKILGMKEPVFLGHDLVMLQASH